MTGYTGCTGCLGKHHPVYPFSSHDPGIVAISQAPISEEVCEVALKHLTGERIKPDKQDASALYPVHPVHPVKKMPE